MMARLGDLVGVHDSKDADSSILEFSRGAWAIFIQELKTGRHDSQ